MALDFDTLTPRLAISVGLLALVPILWYILRRPSNWAIVSAICTLIIVGALYIAMEPVEEGRPAGTNTNS